MEATVKYDMQDFIDISTALFLSALSIILAQVPLSYEATAIIIQDIASILVAGFTIWFLYHRANHKKALTNQIKNEIDNKENE